MLIVETPAFTRQVMNLLSDDEYHRLQVVLANRPNAGAVIRGSGGLRKMRWGMEGKGKSGGVRVIYYWAVQHQQLVMLFMYPKSVQDALTPEQLKVLRGVIEAEYP